MSPISTRLITARLTLKPTKNGGRSSGIRSGYRPTHVFEYPKDETLHAYIGEVEFDDSNWIQPGESRIVNISFVLVPGVEKYLIVGRKWWIHEGHRAIGEAEIIEI